MTQIKRESWSQKLFREQEELNDKTMNLLFGPLGNEYINKHFNFKVISNTTFETSIGTIKL